MLQPKTKIGVTVTVSNGRTQIVTLYFGVTIDKPIHVACTLHVTSQWGGGGGGCFTCFN
jgi:hypothetical protein